MKWGARIFSTTALAFLLAPALLADGTGRPANPSEDEEALSSPLPPGVSDMPKAGAKMALPLRVMLPREGPASEGNGENSNKRARDSKAQDTRTPKVELFVGYTYWWGVPGHADNRIAEMNGASASVAYNFSSYLGLAADVGGFKIDSLYFSSLGAGSAPARVVDADSNVLTFLIGPRVSFRSHTRLTPFLQVLVGAAQADTVTVTGCTAPIYSCVPLPRETAFAFTAGGGLDLRLNRRIAWRVFQAEFLLTRFDDPALAIPKAGWQTNMRLSTGLVFRFGGNSPPPPPPPVNHPPIVSCSINPGMVFAGSGDTAMAHAIASDPDNDPITYSWAANGGAVDGSGADAKWNSSGAAAGTYAVRVHVDDGRGGASDCSADIRVDARPNRPPTMTCSANPPSVFAGERSHIACAAIDPDGDPLTYAWQAYAGKITGNGPMGEFDTSGLSPASYTISTRVDDGRGGTAEAATPVVVKPVPPPPLASKIGECAFGKPLSTRIDNVCKRTLDDVAVRLQKRQTRAGRERPRQQCCEVPQRKGPRLFPRHVPHRQRPSRVGHGKPTYRRHLGS
jgi:hypothetical protein